MPPRLRPHLLLSRLLASGALSLALCACASAPDKLAVCDGRHRRPANPNGSILVAARVRAPSARAGRPDPASLAPCGDAR